MKHAVNKLSLGAEYQYGIRQDTIWRGGSEWKGAAAEGLLSEDDRMFAANLTVAALGAMRENCGSRSGAEHPLMNAECSSRTT
ncbi:MAG: hypothetical protein ACRD51_16985 [Candidatus Acidiferrum sp.]